MDEIELDFHAEAQSRKDQLQSSNQNDLLKPTRTPLRWPVVLVHGMGGFDVIRIEVFKRFPIRVEYFKGIADLLRRHGVPDVHTALVPSTGSIEARAETLKAFIEEHIAPGERCHLIVHSMGGLDSRHYITHLGGAERVASLTTLGTPHRGSPIADVALEKLYRPAHGMANRMGMKSLMARLQASIAATHNLRPEHCAEFNERTPDAPCVAYFSYGGDPPRKAVHWVLRIAYDIMHKSETGGPNDGLVTVESAQWGVWRGTVPADHLSLVNWQFFAPARKAFDPKAFYVSLLEDLVATEAQEADAS